MLAVADAPCTVKPPKLVFEMPGTRTGFEDFEGFGACRESRGALKEPWCVR